MTPNNQPRPAPWTYPFRDHRTQRQVRLDEERQARTERKAS
jgi:hypothetical protein